MRKEHHQFKSAKICWYKADKNLWNIIETPDVILVHYFPAIKFISFQFMYDTSVLKLTDLKFSKKKNLVYFKKVFFKLIKNKPNISKNIHQQRIFLMKMFRFYFWYDKI